MRYTLYIYTLLFPFILISCKQQKAENEIDTDRWTFDSIVVDSIVNLSTIQNSPTAEIHLNIKYATGKKSEKINDSILHCGILIPDYLALISTPLSPQQALDTFLVKYIADYKKSYGDLYARDKEHGASYNMKYSCNTHVTSFRGMFCYVAEVYYYAGGAHGQNLTIVKNIDSSTGQIIRNIDLFVPGYEERLTELIVEKLCKRFKADNLKDLQDKGIFMVADPYVTENVLIGEKSFTFIYCDTEIAPHTMGEIRVDVERDEVKDIMR